MIQRRTFVGAIGAVALSSAFYFPVTSLAAMPKGEGTNPIRIVVPYPPGGPLDVSARTISEAVTATLGNVIVDNRHRQSASQSRAQARLQEEDQLPRPCEKAAGRRRHGGGLHRLEFRPEALQSARRRSEEPLLSPKAQADERRSGRSAKLSTIWFRFLFHEIQSFIRLRKQYFDHHHDYCRQIYNFLRQKNPGLCMMSPMQRTDSKRAAASGICPAPLSGAENPGSKAPVFFKRGIEGRFLRREAGLSCFWPLEKERTPVQGVLRRF